MELHHVKNQINNLSIKTHPETDEGYSVLLSPVITVLCDWMLKSVNMQVATSPEHETDAVQTPDELFTFSVNLSYVD